MASTVQSSTITVLPGMSLCFIYYFYALWWQEWIHFRWRLEGPLFFFLPCIILKCFETCKQSLKKRGGGAQRIFFWSGFDISNAMQCNIKERLQKAHDNSENVKRFDFKPQSVVDVLTKSWGEVVHSWNADSFQFHPFLENIPNFSSSYPHGQVGAAEEAAHLGTMAMEKRVVPWARWPKLLRPTTEHRE